MGGPVVMRDRVEVGLILAVLAVAVAVAALMV